MLGLKSGCRTTAYCHPTPTTYLFIYFLRFPKAFRGKLIMTHRKSPLSLQALAASAFKRRLGLRVWMSWELWGPDRKWAQSFSHWSPGGFRLILCTRVCACVCMCMLLRQGIKDGKGNFFFWLTFQNVLNSFVWNICISDDTLLSDCALFGWMCVTSCVWASIMLLAAQRRSFLDATELPVTLPTVCLPRYHSSVFPAADVSYPRRPFAAGFCSSLLTTLILWHHARIETWNHSSFVKNLKLKKTHRWICFCYHLGFYPSFDLIPRLQRETQLSCKCSHEIMRRCFGIFIVSCFQATLNSTKLFVFRQINQ